MIFGSTLTLPTFVLFFFYFFFRLRFYVLVRVKVRFRVPLLRLVRFNKAYCTLVVSYCDVTSGVLLNFKIHSRICSHCLFLSETGHKCPILQFSFL